MAIAGLGIPVNTHSATGSVTGTWGTGQSRTAGNMLVAIVTCAASTSVTATATASGWTNRIEIPNTATAQVRAAVWTKTAAGADAAPVFTSTETGTAGGMDCMLFELQGANIASPLDVEGDYASGATAGTVSMTATTSANVSTAGEYAIAVFAQEAAAASLTWTDSGTGAFTKLLNGNGATSVLQTYIGVAAGPAAAAALNDAGAFSVNTTAFGAGTVAVFTVAVPSGVITPVEAFANNCAATVTAGGTTAPAGGTSEAWTVNVTSAFPAATTSLQFHAVDLALPAEKFLVTAAPGGTGPAQSWTVTRGSEGTTPAAHAAGFTIVPSVTAGVLSQFSLRMRVNVIQYGADPNGVADSTAAVNAAASAVINTGAGGIVYFPAGNYKISSTITVNTHAPIYFAGDGWYATNIRYYGSGDCFRIYDSILYPVTNFGGGITGMTIDGTNAAAGSCGLHAGDLFQYQLNIAVQNFTGAGSKGVWLDNQQFWTEQLNAYIFAENCTQHVVLDRAAGAAAGATGSFERCNLTVFINQIGPSFDGLVLQNGAFIVDGSVIIRGNFGTFNSSLSSAALRLTGNNPSGGYSSISYSHLDIGVECDLNPAGGYTFAPYTINFGSGSNFISNCYGIINFSASYAFIPCNIGAALSNFSGLVFGDANLHSQYVMANLTVTYPTIWNALLQSNGSVPGANAGMATLYADANSVPSNVMPSGLASRLQQAQYAATSPVTITAAAITSIGSMTVPGNDAVAGAVYRFTAHGTMSTTTGPPTFILDMRWGGTAGTLLTTVQSTATANCPPLTVSMTTVPVLLEGQAEFITATTCVGWLRMTWKNSATAATASTVAMTSITTAVTVTTSSSQVFTADWTWSGTGNTLLVASSNFERVA